MDAVYLKIWEMAKPYYQKGRVYDLEQVAWMMREADFLADKVGADKRILLPLVILHDIGYSAVDNKNPHIKDKVSKKLHMAVGSELTQKILSEVNYELELAEKVSYYVSVHDNWALGDDQPFKESKEMALFNDLDFLYAQSSLAALTYHGASMGLSAKEMYDFWLGDEKLTRRPFCCPETQKMFKDFMAARQQEIATIKE